MPTVILVRADASGKLILDVNGNPSNGRCTATAGDDVQWIVQGGSAIEYIQNIEWKQIAGSENLFSDDPPKAQMNGSSTNYKHWRGSLNRGASDFSVYVYNIYWKKSGVTEIQRFDPIISIKPSRSIPGIIVGALGLIAGGVASLLMWRQKGMIKNENERLKNQIKTLKEKNQ